MFLFLEDWICVASFEMIEQPTVPMPLEKRTTLVCSLAMLWTVPEDDGKVEDSSRERDFCWHQRPICVPNDHWIMNREWTSAFESTMHEWWSAVLRRYSIVKYPFSWWVPVIDSARLFTSFSSLSIVSIHRIWISFRPKSVEWWDLRSIRSSLIRRRHPAIIAPHIENTPEECTWKRSNW